MKAKAEKLYSEGSFQQAHDAYAKIPKDEIPQNQKHWVDLRLAQTEARSQASSRRNDSSRLEESKKRLQTFIGDEQAEDRIWAEAQETLGDLDWTSPVSRNWGAAWPYYEKALGYWAGSTNLNVAARKYWEIVTKASEPPERQPYAFYGSYGYLPLDILENALKIAGTAEQKARAHFMIAMTLRNQGGEWEQRFRIPLEFEAALKAADGTRWEADALYFYAEWMNSSGKAVQDENGNWSFHPDYAKALQLYQRLTTSFQKGQTRWHDAAKNRAEEITKSVVNVTVGNVFLPASEIEFNLNWRNVTNIDFELYRCDLVEDVSFKEGTGSNRDWMHNVELRHRDPVKKWTRQTLPKGPHVPGNETIRLDEKLKPGAYLLAARSGETESRELILVSDLSVVVQSAAGKTVVYACDSAAGAPASGAEVRLWERYFDGSKQHWEAHSKQADGQGIAVFDLNEHHGQVEIFVTAKSEDRQAFSNGFSGMRQSQRDQWKIYAFTDRPAYRPGETVHWKFTARVQNGESYAVPSSRKIVFRITDPRGGELKKESGTLNSFGSAWGEIALGSEVPLGEYRFTAENNGEQVASGTLFRVEEYKLPEFKVAIQTPEENGRKKTFLLGEKVEVNIQADYYFGGPVANAAVEAVIYQAPLYHIWSEPREFDWYFDQPETRFRRQDPGQVIQREKLQTDSEGKAHLIIQTPLGATTDLDYRIEARVTDASRREIISTANVRVGRQRFYVYPQPEHKIFQPHDKVTVDFKTLDANDQPVVAEGKVQVTRDYWYEVWTAPDGHDVQGAELDELRRTAIFPPPVPPGAQPWRPKSRGYRHEDILTRTLKSGTNGLASLTFTPEREGYYRLTWRSDDEIKAGAIPSRPVRAETTVWVATTRSSDLGYRPGGLEILADKESFKAGEKAPVMLSVPTNDRYVLLTVTGSGLIDYQLIHLSGTVKLVELPIDERHVPNFFLNAVMISDQNMFSDQEEIIVPPVKNFLDVKLTADREEHRPGEKGTLRIETRDNEGKPVSAEVALGVIDESVFYIQQDYAGDPRKFFFGSKRSNIANTGSSFNSLQYRKLLPKREEEAEAALAKDERDLFRNRFAGEAGVQGGTAPAPAGGMILGRNFAYKTAANDLGMPAPRKEKTITLLSSAVVAAPQADEAAATAPVQVRADFRSTVLWQPDIKTGEDGKARVSFTYPDSLTSWKSTARAASGNQFGIGETTTRTKQPFIARLEAPRFFLVGDTVTISAVLNNNTSEEFTATPTLEGTGIDIPNSRHDAVTVPPGGEARADWVVHPAAPGKITLKLTARAGEYSDGMEKSFTSYEHGIEKFLAVSGKSRADEVTTALVLPKERKPGSTRFNVRVTPSMAVTMLDALPYLIDYPYGCTEQTMSRFLPAVITARTLKDLGLNAEDIIGRAFGGVEQGTAEKTHPGHKNGARNLQKLNELAAQGLQRLYDFQHDDGGWGWWKEDRSDRFMSAYVVWGLVLARQGGVEIHDQVLQHGAQFLEKELVQDESALDEQAWLLHALAAKHESEHARKLTEFESKAWQNLWKRRDELNAYGRALLALSAHYFGKADDAKVLVRNLENGVKTEKAPEASVILGKPVAANPDALATAHWGEDGIRWHWSEGGVEPSAFVLRALLAIDPKNKLVDPAANWLVKNRRGAQWSNTRNTAIVVLALNDYLKASGELKEDLDYELFVNGTSQGEKSISGDDVFSAPESFEIPAKLLRNGTNEIRIVRNGGTAPIYFAVECSFFSLEEPIQPAGNEIFATRQYFHLQPVPTLLNGDTFAKHELKPGDTIASGDRIETVITIEAKNNYEYLIFEDLKPAGIEAVELRSGEPLYAHRVKEAEIAKQFVSRARAVNPKRTGYIPTPGGDSRPIHEELRDRKVALFIDKLPEGYWQIRYETRAEVPGKFHALPLVAHAMYVPEIRANSSETNLIIRERKDSDEK